MSIIHEALKKAQNKPEVEEKLSQTNLEKSGQKAAPKAKKQTSKTTVLLLGGVLVLALGYLLFGQELQLMIAKKTGASKVVLPKAVAVPAVPVGQVPKAAVPKSGAVVQGSQDDDSEKVEMLNRKIALHYDKAQYEEGLAKIEELILLRPISPEVYNNYGLFLKKLGRKAEAKEAYNKALALKANYPEALNNLAVISISSGRHSEAKRLLSKALELKPDYLDAQLHLAIAFEKNEEEGRARDLYEKFLINSEGKVDRRIRLQVEDRLSTLIDL